MNQISLLPIYRLLSHGKLLYFRNIYDLLTRNNYTLYIYFIHIDFALNTNAFVTPLFLLSRLLSDNK